MPFSDRHIGPDEHDIRDMLEALGQNHLDEFIERVIPAAIRSTSVDSLGEALSEEQALAQLRSLADQNTVMKSFTGQGYYDTYLPEVIRRNVLENPGWYTAYTPYQPEIAQGRLEVLFNFQTLISELTGMEIANASLLDEATAAAEAMAMSHRTLRGRKHLYCVANDCHPQTIDVLRTRAEPLGITVQLIDPDADLDIDDDCFGVLYQYPATDGSVRDYTSVNEQWAAAGALVTIAADPLALCLLKTPADMGADIAVGSTQRFGVPMGFGGPHAAYMATQSRHKRNMPGRLIGLSKDVSGSPAYRLALQTREQHIRREKATSNICTAQALLAIIATLYACYHGPAGLQKTARRVQSLALSLKDALTREEVSVLTENVFDTVRIRCDVSVVVARAKEQGCNVREFDRDSISISVDETTTPEDIDLLLSIVLNRQVSSMSASPADNQQLPENLLRSDTFMTQECFHLYRSETEMMRYLRILSDRDIALDRAMIPLGSCTMKLNAAAEMAGITWPAFSNIHPYAPEEQTQGYRTLISELEQMLCACTGYAAVSLQPNAGSQGEYAGLLAIRAYHASRGEADRDVCLIPESAHGTNPASAQMAGLRVVIIACDDHGNIDINDLKRRLDQHASKVSAIMITYPSTHGVFEEEVKTVCSLVHEAGGQVYIDGANLNAMVGLAEPGRFGGDVSHLNLHKTFCIPHGGGGPGVGPIGVAEHLAPFLPGHREWQQAAGSEPVSAAPVSAAPWGSALILPITWMYLKMMGGAGLTRATQVAILSANYIAHELSRDYPVLYQGANGFVAHECILDLRPVRNECGITVDDIAKRLIDYGFHAPTMSFPVSGTLMIEPTESESKAEVDRFVAAMRSIKHEINEILDGRCSATDNPLVHAPHTASVLLSENWDRCYPRDYGAFPDGDNRRTSKYWPPVGRVDNVFGDKNLVCSCPPVASYAE